MGILLSRLHHRPLRATALLWLLYALFLIAGVAQAAIVPLLPRLSERFGLSATAAALLLALPGLATLAVSVPAGVAADRFGARRVSLAAGVLLCVSCVAQAASSLTLLMAGRLVFGVAFGVVWTTGMAWLSDLDDGSGATLGPSVTCSSVGIMAGPAIAGALAQTAGVGLPFLVVAVVSAAVVVPLAAVARGTGEPRVTALPGAATDAGDAEGGDAEGAGDAGDPGRTPERLTGRRAAAAALRRPGVVAAAGALAVSGAVSGVSQLLISGGLHQVGMSTARIGIAFSASAVCYIVVSAGVVRAGDRARTLRFNAVSTAILALALMPALAGVGAVGLVAALMLTAAPRAAISTVAYGLAAGSGERDQSQDGLVFGMLNGAWAAATVLMPLVAGALEQHDGAGAGYLGVMVPAVAVACWLIVRSWGGMGAVAVSVRVVGSRAGAARVVVPLRGHGGRLRRASVGAGLRAARAGRTGARRISARQIGPGRAVAVRIRTGQVDACTGRAGHTHAQRGPGAQAHAHAAVRLLR